MFSWLYELPTWVGGTLFALGSMALGLAGMFALRPWFHHLIHRNDKTNEMVSLNIASFSVFYGILLGLVAVGVYANYSATSDIVEREASSVAALYSDTSALPEPSRSKLLSDLRDYAKVTIEKDWPTQAKGNVPTSGTQRLAVFQSDLKQVHPVGKAEEVSLVLALGQTEKLVESRASRLDRVTVSTPILLWWVLGIGALLTITIIWMLDMEIHIHAILTAILSMFLGIVIFVVAEMDRPFRGEVFVGPDAYELIYINLMRVG